MIIDCVGCLHGYYPKLEGGDLLIVTGDLTARSTDKEWSQYVTWMNNQNYQKIVFIAGNHDTMIERWDKEQDKEGYKGPVSDPDERIEYLCDSGAEFEGLKIWGSPWTLKFKGQNPHAMAFTCETEEQLEKKWNLILDDIDILITHSPFLHMLDQNRNGYACGSYTLRQAIDRIKPKIHVCGHIHEQGGNTILYKHLGPNTFCVNACIVNERYQHVNKPVRIIL